MNQVTETGNLFFQTFITKVNVENMSNIRRKLYSKIEIPNMNQITDMDNLFFQTFITKVNIDNTGSH